MSSRRGSNVNRSDTNLHVVFDGNVSDYIPYDQRSAVSTLSDGNRTAGNPQCPMNDLALLKRGYIEKNAPNYNRYNKLPPITAEELAKRGCMLPGGKKVRSLKAMKKELKRDDLSSNRSSSCKSPMPPQKVMSLLSVESCAEMLEPELESAMFTIGQPEDNARVKICTVKEGIRYEMDIDKKFFCIFQTTKKSKVLVSWNEE